MTEIGSLQDVWTASRPARASEGAWSSLFREVLDAYREPARHYHTVEHLEEMVAVVSGAPEGPDQPRVAYLSVFFHDAVLVSGAKDNEARSAELARARLQPWLDVDELDRIEEIVLATRGHEHDLSDRDRTIVLDADLAILGASRERYRRYAQGIREEYRHVPGPVFRFHRRKFLKELLARPFLYGDPRIAEELEGAARANLQAELDG